MPGILEQYISILIAGVKTSQLVIDILIAVVIDVGKGHAMPLLQMSKAARGGHILKSLAPVVAEHHIRDQHFVVGSSGSQIDIEKTIVVQIAKICPHWQVGMIESHRCGHIRETALSIVAVEARRNARMLLIPIVGHNVGQCAIVGSDKQVQIAVVVIVEEPRGETGAGRFRYAELVGYVGKGTIRIVAVESIFSRVRNVEVQIAIVVVVAGGDAFGVAIVGDPGTEGDIGKRAIAIVLKQLRRIATNAGVLPQSRLVADVKIEIAVVVKIAPDGGLRGTRRFGQSRLTGHIRKRSVAIVPQQRVANLAIVQ